MLYHWRIMQTQEPAELPEVLDFSRQVELNRKLEGVFPLSKLTRLSEFLLNNGGYITAKLVFSDSAGFACLKGRVFANVLVECQRCLEPVETELSGDFKFALVNSEVDIEDLPDALEPYLVEGEEQSVLDLIEDELLLCLPMVTIHEKDCSEYMMKQNKKISAEIEVQKEAAKAADNPFAALQALKEDLNKKIN